MSLLVSQNTPEVNLELTNADDFLPIEDTMLPPDLLHLRHMPRFVVYQIVDLAPPTAPMSSDDFAEHLSKRKAPKESKFTAVEYRSQKPVKECEPENWLSFMDATSAAASVGAYVGFVYANFGVVPQEALEEITLPVELVIAASQGRLIMPVTPYSKEPKLTRYIYGSSPATCDLLQIKRWFALFPRCSWGVRTGADAGFMGLDIDTEEGQQWLESKPALPVTYTVKTGSPKAFKKHYYLALPPGMEVIGKASRLAPGVDTRGYHNILVIAPSIHKTGGQYRVEVEAPTAPLPQWLIDELRAKSLIEDAITPKKERPAVTVAPSDLTDEEYDYALNMYRDRLGAPFIPGTEHDQVIAAGLFAGNLVGAGRFDEELLKGMAEESAFAYVEDNKRKRNFDSDWAWGFERGLPSPWESPWSVAAANRIGFGNAPLPDGAIAPEVWEQQKKAQSAAIAEKLAAERAQEPEQSVAPQQDSWQLPPGLVGDVARFIYTSAYKPNQEVALAGAITFLAGIAGRQYNTSTSTGLNQYVILLAETSRGKEGAATGMGKLRRAMNTADLSRSVDQFIGPGAIPSSPALKKRLVESECFYASMGEFGKTLQKMTARNANPNDTELMGTLMDVFMKSGKDSSLKASPYASKEAIPEIHSPCVSIIGDSTPGDFYKAMTLSDFASGLIPRLTIIEHIGKIPPSNKQKGIIPPPELVNRLIKLVRTLIKLQQADHKVIEVDMSPEAQAFTDQFEREYERRIEQHPGTLAQLWSRSHLRLLRLASLVAVGSLDWSNEPADFTCVVPTVTLPMVQWAADLITRSNQIVEQRVSNGDIGQTGEAAEQRQAIESCIHRFVKGKYKAGWASHSVTEAMHSEGLISYRYIQNFTKNKKCFTSQDYGKAADAILRNLVDAEFIKPLNVTNSLNGAVSKQYQILTTEGLHEGEV